jgi:hypothetical protein
VIPAQIREAAAMSEAELQRKVRAMCKARDLGVQHVGNSLAGRVWMPGWPDLDVLGFESYKSHGTMQWRGIGLYADDDDGGRVGET